MHIFFYSIYESLRKKCALFIYKNPNFLGICKYNNNYINRQIFMSKQELLKSISNLERLLGYYKESINNSHIPMYFYKYDMEREGIQIENFLNKY